MSTARVRTSPQHSTTPAAEVLVRQTVARGGLAGVLYGLDNVGLDGRPVRRRPLPDERIVRVGGLPCTDGVQTLVDLAAVLDDLRLGAGARIGVAQRAGVDRGPLRLLPELGRARTPGTSGPPPGPPVAGPDGAAPTGSLLETIHDPVDSDCPRCAGPGAAAPGGLRRCLTSPGPRSGSSSSWMASSTRASPSTTPGGKPLSWPPPAGCAGDSPGTRSCGCPPSTGRRLAAVYQQALLRPIVVRFVHP